MSKTDSLDFNLSDPCLLFQILENLGSSVMVVDLERKIRYINQKVEELTGYNKKELIDRSLQELLFLIFSQDLCQFERILKENKCEFDTLLRKKDGTTFFAHVIATVLKYEKKAVGIVVNFFDITEKKELEKSLYEAAITDYLTGLYNRRYLELFLKREKAISDRYNLPFSIILLDLDNFKLINDIYGHEIGDKVLVEVAKLLKDNLRSTDIIGRWGGEEFLIILPNTNFEQALNVAEKLRALLCTLSIPPVERITASFGVSEYKKEEPYEKTLKRADLALYKAKAEGKNCVVVF
ncbi:MAG: sensor domain-containing diguanylate cyclase [Caldimicrobium sp.]